MIMAKLAAEYYWYRDNDNSDWEVLKVEKEYASWFEPQVMTDCIPVKDLHGEWIKICPPTK